MANTKKIEAVKQLKEKFQNVSTIVFVDYRGITVSEDTEFRKKAREAGVDYFVAKNRLVKIALKEAGIDVNFDDVLEGTTAFALGNEDLVAPAKVIYEFGKDLKDKFNIKAGLLEGKRISLEEVENLATLPSKEILISRLLAGLQSPITGLLNVLQGNVRKLVYVLDAIAKKGE